MMSSMKSNEPGFEAVAVPDGRRGLWMRVKRNEAGAIIEIEIAAGREGDDSGMTLREGEVITTDTLRMVEDCFTTLRFGAESASTGWNAEIDTIPIPSPEELLAEGWRELPKVLGSGWRWFACPRGTRGTFVVCLPPRNEGEARHVRETLKNAREAADG